MRAYQRADILGDAARDELKSAAEAFISSVVRWPSKGVQQALRQSLARAGSAQFTTPDDTTREQALRKICIHAEILSNAATPHEDAGLRREHELQMLRQGLGQARQADARAWDAMRIEWLGLAAADPAVHDQLERRFMRCLKQRLANPEKSTLVRIAPAVSISDLGGKPARQYRHLQNFDRLSA